MALSDAALDFSAEGKDWLTRLPAVEALHRTVAGEGLATPVVLGIYGGWGSGKTSVMKTLQAKLGDRLIVWFDAWVYARQDETLWRALLLAVIEQMRRWAERPEDSARPKDFDAAKVMKRLDEAQESLYRSMTMSEKGALRVRWSAAVPLVADAALAALTAGISQHISAVVKEGAKGPVSAVVDWLKGSGKDEKGKVKELTELFEREATERYVAQVVSLEQFQHTLRELLEMFGIGEQGRKLHVFVDDLDRCLPENAVAALEAIKLFLDLPGCIFILGMDRQVVEQGVRVRYAALKDERFDAGAYLDKIIQVPFNLPVLGRAQIRQYLANMKTVPGLELYADLILTASPPNPRTLKRVVNALQLVLYLDGGDDNALRRIDRQSPEGVRVRRLAKLVLLQVCFGTEWQELTKGRTTLLQIQEHASERLKDLMQIEPKLANLGSDETESLLAVTRLVQPAPP